jgi:hypothetical protein
MADTFDSIPEPILTGYEEKLKNAGYVVFEHEGDWYYNAIGEGDEFSDGPYSSRAEVLVEACRNLRLINTTARVAAR